MKYVANPVMVDAKVIVQIGNDIDGRLVLYTNEDTIINIDEAVYARYFPKPGDYWVKQEDGYGYINPKSVFERKYSLLKNQE